MTSAVSISDYLRPDELFKIFKYLVESKDFQAGKVCRLWNEVLNSAINSRLVRIPRSIGNSILDMPSKEQVMGLGISGLKDFNSRVLTSAGLPLLRKTLCINASQVRAIEDQSLLSFIAFWDQLSPHLDFDVDPAPKTHEEIMKWLKDPSNAEQLMRIESLTITDAHMTILPPEIALLPNLKMLNLVHTSLRFLCPQITALASLEILDLSFTQLEELPEDFDRLSKLRILNVESTPLKALPKSVLDLQENGKLKTVISRFNTNNKSSGPLARVRQSEADLIQRSQSRRGAFPAFTNKTTIKDIKEL